MSPTDSTGQPEPIEQQQPPQSGKRIRRIAVGVVLGVGVVVGGLSVGMRPYVNRTLLPQIEDSLERTLDRPLDLGQVQVLLPWQATVGTTEIEDLGTIESIDIRFNLLSALLSRQLKVGVQLNRAEIVLAESAERGWNVVQFNLDDTGGGLPLTELDVSLRNSSISLVPLEGDPLQIANIRGRSSIVLDDPAGPNLDFNLRSQLESAPIQLRGTARLDAAPRVDVALQGQELPIAIVDRIAPTLPLQPQAGQLAVDLQLLWQAEQTPEVTGQIELQDGTVYLPQLDRTVADLNGQFELARQTVSLVDVSGQIGGVPFSTEGTLDWADVLDWEGLQLPFSGPTGEETPPQNPSVSHWDGNLGNGDRILLASGFSYPTPIAQAGDGATPAAPQLDLAVTIPSTDISELFNLVDFVPPVPMSGAIASTFTVGGSLTRPEIQGTFESAEAIEIDRIQIPQLTGQFALADRILSLADINANLQAGEIDAGQLTGNGTVQLGSPLQSNLQVLGSRVNLDAIVARYDGVSIPFPLGINDINATIASVGTNLSATASWQGGITGNGQMQLTDGTFSIPQSQFALGTGTVALSLTSPAPRGAATRSFQARLRPNRVPLNQFVAGQRGFVSGDIQLAGNTADLSLAGLRGSGPITLTQLAGLPGAISAHLVWDGAGITVSNGDALGLVAISGRIPVNPYTLAIGSVNLTISTTDLSLEQLPQRLPDLLPEILPKFPFRGRLNLKGELTGTPDALQLSAQTSLLDLVAAGLEFSPLQGTVTWQSARGASLDLTGSSASPDLPPDRIALQLGPDFIPQSFQLRQGITEAIGDRQGNQFQVQLTQLPLALLTVLAPGYFGGSLDSNFTIDWEARAVAGHFSADRPHWSGLRASRLQGDFAWDNNRLALANGEFSLDNSLYSINGAIVLPSNTGTIVRRGQRVRSQPVPAEIDLNLSTQTGSLEDLLTALDWQEWSDVAQSFQIPELGTADDLFVNPISVLQRSLYERISIYADRVIQWQAYLAAQTDPRLPDLSELGGQFQGELRAVGLVTNPVVQFDIRGQNWSLEEFQLEEVVARGRFWEQQLDVVALEGRTGDRSGRLQGTFGSDRISGSLTVERAPIELLQRFLPQVPPFSGDLGMTAQLEGNLQAPAASGQLQLERAQFNQQPLYSASGTFDYRTGQLSLDSNLILDLQTIDHPIALQGTIPFPIPLLDVEPPSNDIVLSISTSDGGLQVTNLFFSQLQVQDVRGQLSAELRGSLRNPTLQGSLSVENATAEVGFLPAPLKQVQAQVSFDSDTIHVRSFSSSFSGDDITAEGYIPIVDPSRLMSEESPLAVDIEGLSIDWPNLYAGNVNGHLEIANSVLAPRISGNLVLTNGVVDLSSRQTTTSVTAEIVGPRWQQEFRFDPQFDGLTIALAEEVDVDQNPLFRFSAEGEMTFYGPVESLQADGTIFLTRGVVTIGPALLRLDRSWPNTAIFQRDRGLDPNLNVRLVARATEVGRGLTEAAGARDFLFTDELSGTSGRDGQQGADQLQTIEVRATVQGPASDLAASGLEARIVELSSIPPRSEGEIVTLLGAGAVEGLLGNVLESTLSRVLFGGQNRLGDALGLDEINIGTFVGTENNTSLGVEASKDLGGNVSITGEASLTDNTENPRLGARYRLSDRLIIRGRSDFNEDTRGSLELETRF
ncbi:translocation/assembly module TamB domain-containing protein [Synechococcus sp. PCC 7336]|uniref:translocation/assembly module TamB domain-containing protein n=1 Tax=Synechococcus sp. PCC 7336 TaxID=195250 RepID=UPI0003490C15|nr:translocation/assembly module TamB domain-containing protein [Synechococcus sp. PCC 7336]